MKSVMGSNNRRYYVLEHKVSSSYHKAGESQPIIVDQIELGRDPKCQVRFDESFVTVSRRHAAIVKDGDNWKLVQLSKTNSTYLNGKKVDTEWYLQSGDEIQLSTNGPKLGFIVPQGDKGLVKSIGLSVRMNLFRQQALRPYRTAITVLSCMFLIAVGVGVGVVTKQNDVLAEYKRQTELDSARKDSLISALQADNNSLLADNARRDEEIDEMRRRMNDYVERPPVQTNVVGGVDNAAIDRCLPGVYYIQSVSFDITLPNGEYGHLSCSDEGVPSWSGSGFLLNNGTFVTARHVVEPWFFWEDGEGVDENMAMLNSYVNNGGKVVSHIMAVSSTGRKLEFTSSQFNIDRSHDRSARLSNGTRLSLASIDATDCASCRVSSASGGLDYDVQKSVSLRRGEDLTILGFPLGFGVESSNSVSPVYGSAVVAYPGLHEGTILTTASNFEHGNSGGPVFYTNSSGKLVVVGIVSAGAGRSLGCIVPISKVLR